MVKCIEEDEEDISKANLMRVEKKLMIFFSKNVAGGLSNYNCINPQEYKKLKRSILN